MSLDGRIGCGATNVGRPRGRLEERVWRLSPRYARSMADAWAMLVRRRRVLLLAAGPAQPSILVTTREDSATCDGGRQVSRVSPTAHTGRAGVSLLGFWSLCRGPSVNCGAALRRRSGDVGGVEDVADDAAMWRRCAGVGEQCTEFVRHVDGRGQGPAASSLLTSSSAC